MQTSPTGTWFQTPEAFDFFASMPDLFRPFVVAVERISGLEVRGLVGVCVGYVTIERNPIKQYFTRRAIIVGGPCLADDCTDEEVTALMTAVKHSLTHSLIHSPIYIESRNFNDYSRWKNAFVKAGFDYVPHLNFHVDTSSVEIVEANLGKSRKRDIRTTIREGATITLLSNDGMSREQNSLNESHCVFNDEEREQKVREYYEILNNLYKTKVKTPLFPVEFFLQLSKHKDARFLLIELKGKIIGGTVCVEFRKFNSSIINQQSSNNTDGVVYEWFVCGEDGVYPHVFPSCYATYAGMKYAAEHGCVRFDMMGAGKPGEAYGVRDFKAKFGGQEVEYGRFLCLTKPVLYKLGVLSLKLIKRLL